MVYCLNLLINDFKTQIRSRRSTKAISTVFDVHRKADEAYIIEAI